MSWQTRVLATMIAGGYMIDAKKGNPALEAATKLAIDDLEAAQLEVAEQVAERQKAQKVNDFGKVMQFFGGGALLGPGEEGTPVFHESGEGGES